MSEICKGCTKRVYAAEWVIACESKWHKMCLKCTHCSKLLQLGQYSEREGLPYCKTDYDRLFRQAGYGHGGVTDSYEAQPKQDAPVEAVTPVSPTFTQETPSDDVQLFPTNCPKCGKRAYENEKKVFNSRDWHRTCFACFTCKKNLVSGQYSEKNGAIYCNRCYESRFGAKGFGFGGAAVLH
ncbi:hypothetical protein CYY_006221 [Polysphondylium violaceum]|uniref:LIM zinc-binding domain-containing protein n=1 Tax=Polysphondylium violaceum TaxID=133409 RepID=A0A8J4URM9_9MYCE|nr:hypothetical protein CYY_006221 [Polysphondylium violaceum]